MKNLIITRSDSEDEDDDDDMDGRLEDLIDDNPIEDDNSDGEDSDRSGSQFFRFFFIVLILAFTFQEVQNVENEATMKTNWMIAWKMMIMI